MSDIEFKTSSGSVKLLSDGTVQGGMDGIGWAIRAMELEPLTVTPAGPVIERVLDVERPLQTVLTLMVISQADKFSTRPPELAKMAREKVAELMAVPEGCIP